MALSTLFFACNNAGNTFVLKGKFKNFNQGELYVYTLTGKARIDTIHLVNGKFSYQSGIEDTTMLSVVFPNYSEIPVIASPSATLSMEGDASHLREVTVKGNDANKLLTEFRLRVNEMTPPQARKAAAEFINDNPSSPANLYLLNKYFLLTDDIDYAKVTELLKAMTKATPGNLRLKEIKQQVESLKKAKVGNSLPAFKAVTTNGARVTKTDLQGTINVISVWSTWNFESQRCQRELKKLKRECGSRLQLLSICLDGNPDDCKRQMNRDSINWYTVCDGKMWNSDIVKTLGIYNANDNFVIDSKGKITDRGLPLENLKKRIEKALK